MANKEIEIIKQFYSALNRNEVDVAMSLMDANIVRLEFEGSPSGGTFRGLAELRQNFIAGRSTWAEGACEPIEFFPHGNKVVVIAHVKVRLKNNTNWIDAQVADGFAVKDGLLTEFHSFVSKEKAFAWART